MARDFTKSPYTNDEKRVAHWLHEKGGIGGGDDPIGFLIASHEYINAERLDFKRQVAALQLDNDRLYALSVNKQDVSELSDDDLGENDFQMAQEWARRGRAAQNAVNELIKGDRIEDGKVIIDGKIVGHQG